jgi:hypothetical protein
MDALIGNLTWSEIEIEIEFIIQIPGAPSEFWRSLNNGTFQYIQYEFFYIYLTAIAIEIRCPPGRGPVQWLKNYEMDIEPETGGQIKQTIFTGKYMGRQCIEFCMKNRQCR